MKNFMQINSFNSVYTDELLSLDRENQEVESNRREQFNLTYNKDNKSKCANRIRLKKVLQNKDQIEKRRSSLSAVAFMGVKTKPIKFEYYYKSIKQQQKEKKQLDIQTLSNMRTLPTTEKTMSQQMLESMKKYLRKIQKNKLQLKQKSEQSHSFGLKVQSIQKQIHFSGQSDNTFNKSTQSPKKSFLLTKKIISNKSQLMNLNNEAEEFNSHSKTESFINLRIDQKNITVKQALNKSKYKNQDPKRQNTIKYRRELMQKNMNILMNSYKCRLVESSQLNKELEQLTKLQQKSSKLQLVSKLQQSSGKQSNKNKYTYFIGYGNNRNLIKSIFKKRWWWSQTTSINQANFIWTQLKNTQILDKIKIQKQKCEQLSQNCNDQFVFGNKNNLSEDIQVKLQKKRIKLKSNQFLNIFQTTILQKYHNIFHKSAPLQQICSNSLNQTTKGFMQIQKPNCVHNHYQQNYMFGNKNALFHNIRAYFEYLKEDMFSIVPLTFYIDKKEKSSLKQFQIAFKEATQKKSIWIVKPAQNSNRGQGIFVSNNLQQIKRLVTSKKQGKYILQKYLKNNFLFQKRKFDIRTYMLMVTIGKTTKFFWYKEGYLRTSSQIFNLSDLTDIYVHLTNDAIQITSQNYGKYENGNKLTYVQFQRYLDLNYPDKNYSMQALNMQMKNIAKKSVNAIYPKINTSKTSFSFQLFGLDFLIDSSFKPWLLQINTNPCLQLSSPILQRLIPRVIQNIWRITVDIMFQPQQKSSCTKSCSYFVYDNVFQSNKFELIFDSSYDRDLNWEQICKNTKQSAQIYQDQTQVFANDGKEIQIQF